MPAGIVYNYLLITYLSAVITLFEKSAIVSIITSLCALCTLVTLDNVLFRIELISKMHTCTHAHTHNRFTALLDFVRDYPGEPAPER